MLQIGLVLGGVFALAGLFMKVIDLLARSSFVQARRFRTDRAASVSPEQHDRTSMVNSLLSTALFFGVLLPFRDFMFGPQPGWLGTLGQVVAVLLAYDFVYYLYHRFVLHEWTVGRRIHAVHHAIRTPYAKDSMYIHPAETVGGLVIFFGALALVKPGLVSFGIVFALHSLLNILIHAGVGMKGKFASVTALVRHHDIHHANMKAGYYGSITPIWDLLFGTTGDPGQVERDAPVGSA